MRTTNEDECELNCDAPFLIRRRASAETRRSGEVPGDIGNGEGSRASRRLMEKVLLNNASLPLYMTERT